MKKIFLVLSLVFLVSCANTADTFTGKPLDGEYRITEVDGKKIIPGEFIITFDPIGNRVSGRTGCNNFSANYNQNGPQIDFSTPMNTRKYCEGRMEIERQILSSIERASLLQIDGSEIIIFAEEDKPLITLTKMK